MIISPLPRNDALTPLFGRFETRETSRVTLLALLLVDTIQAHIADIVICDSTLFFAHRGQACPPTISMLANPPHTRGIVLISGNGSNLQALIDATHSTLPHLEIVRVVSNKKDAYGLTRAVKASIPTLYHNLYAAPRRYIIPKDPTMTPEKKQAAREEYDADLARLLLDDKPDIIICAGWMHILAPTFLDPLSAAGVPVINLHPALPGQYDGAGAIQRAWTDCQEGRLERNTTGIMVHYVISEVDRGEPIVVREVQCSREESLEDLEMRIHEQEHTIIVEGAALAICRLWEQRHAAEK